MNAEQMIGGLTCLKIRKRGVSKVVVRPDGQVDAPGKASTNTTSRCWWR